jgi:uncharacterized protein YpbB
LGIIDLLSATKRETYNQFEIEKMSISDIASSRALTEGTIMDHLEDAIINGLAVNFKRLHITLEDIQKLRKPPINSNILNLAVIKEQEPDLDCCQLGIMMALIKKKYGLCREELTNKTLSIYQSRTSRSVKRAWSDHDSSKQEHTVVKDKA